MPNEDPNPPRRPGGIGIALALMALSLPRPGGDDPLGDFLRGEPLPEPPMAEPGEAQEKPE